MAPVRSDSSSAVPHLDGVVGRATGLADRRRRHRRWRCARSSASSGWPASPRRRRRCGPTSGTRTSVMYTSLNSASPVIWRSGRTSTPAACMSSAKYVMPLCLGASGSVRVDEHPAVGEVGERVPHLLAVDDPLVAVAHGPGAEAGEVRAGAGLAEQLAPRLLAGEHRAQEALLDLVAAVGDDRRAGQGHEERARVGRLGPRLDQAPLDEPVQLRPHAEAAVTLGEVHPGQPGVELRAAEVDVVRRRRGRGRRAGRRSPPRPAGSRDRIRRWSWQRP